MNHKICLDINHKIIKSNISFFINFFYLEKGKKNQDEDIIN